MDLEHTTAVLSPLRASEIIKVAGNLAYPTGPWLEDAALRLFACGRKNRGAAWRRWLARAATLSPCWERRPGQKGASLPGDGAPAGGRRSGGPGHRGQYNHQPPFRAGGPRPWIRRILIIESGLALAQEIHDGPFELFTGHGLWARKRGEPTFSLRDKKVVRIDLDPHISNVSGNMQRQKAKAVSQAIHTRQTKSRGPGAPLPHGVLRIRPHSRIHVPITADLGMVWPLMAGRAAASGLGVRSGRLCVTNKGTGLGESLREFIVQHVTPMKISP